MTSHLLHIGHLDCHCVTPAPDCRRVIYILFPLQGVEGGITNIATESHAAVVSISGMDWDNDLTPWAAPGAPAGSPPFQGLAPEFLRSLTDDVIPRCEAALKVLPERRQLIGVSLSGLFALWQWMLTPLFDDIASISGSFWYEGFTAWLRSITIPQRKGLAWFCLGDREAHTNVAAFKSVAIDTQTVIATLRGAGINAHFRSVPGNHYQHLESRLALALEALSKDC